MNDIAKTLSSENRVLLGEGKPGLWTLLGGSFGSVDDGGTLNAAGAQGYLAKKKKYALTGGGGYGSSPATGATGGGTSPYVPGGTPGRPQQ